MRFSVCRPAPVHGRGHPMGRALQYCLVYGATILAGIALSRECARSTGTPKPCRVHHATAVARVNGESALPPRLASHPPDALRVIPDRTRTPMPARGSEARIPLDSPPVRPGIVRSPWLLPAGGGLILVSLILRWKLPQRPADEAKILAETRSSAAVLEALIANRLPIVEEPLLLRHEMQIFGRPKNEPQFRIDAAQSLHGPNYALKSEPAGRTAARTGVDRRNSQAAGSDGNLTRVDHGEYRLAGPGALDRALAVLEGDCL